MRARNHGVVGLVAVIVTLTWTCTAEGQAATVVAAADSVSAADPYPLSAAGWGPEAGKGLFVSRWAEDWTERRAAGVAPPMKAIPLGRGASLTLSAESRRRYDSFDGAGASRPPDDSGWPGARLTRGG